MLHDLELQASEGVVPLSIDHRHINIEQAQETIRFILHLGRLPLRSPRHSLSHANIPPRVRQENLSRDPSDLCDERLEARFGPDFFPVATEEGHVLRCDQFLKRPSASKPLTIAELGALGKWILIARHIRHVCVARLRLSVPMEHGIERFRKLHLICLVDTACVNPHIFESYGTGLLAAADNLLIAFGVFQLLGAVAKLTLLDILERDFLFSPSVGEDYVVGNIRFRWAWEGLHYDFFGVHKTHCVEVAGLGEVSREEKFNEAYGKRLTGRWPATGKARTGQVLISFGCERTVCTTYNYVLRTVALQNRLQLLNELTVYS